MGIYQKYQRLIGADKNFILSNENVQVTGSAASELIKQKILGSEPFMISRFGSNELTCILNNYFINTGFTGNIANIAKGIPYFFSVKKSIIENMDLVAGFFSPTKENIKRFCEMSMEDVPEIDVLGSWLSYEKYLFKYFNKNHVRIQLEDLSPFNHPNPWTKALEGKKVLVVHPFEESITEQYKKRDFLFKNKDVLPAFDMKIVKAVQSNGNNDTIYKTWFDALDAMTEQIAKVDFEVAILGCGAYGMPLAARIKRMGKKAIHVGGAVQCIFGIKGKRWEIPFYNYQEKFYNDYWVRPKETEKPKEVNKVEGATYW